MNMAVVRASLPPSFGCVCTVCVAIFLNGVAVSSLAVPVGLFSPNFVIIYSLGLCQHRCDVSPDTVSGVRAAIKVSEGNVALPNAGQLALAWRIVKI